MGNRRKLEGDDVKVVKSLANKRVKREIDPCLQNHLDESHIAASGEMWSLIPSSPASQVPKPKLTKNETQLLVRETRDLVLADIPGVRVHRQGLMPPDELAPSDHWTSDASTNREDH